ncbi:LolA-like protein [Anaeromyxobacter paludicola]|uniref:Outer membrane lipoprotein-sorting protein n=1 Tax=Anaeromyxobacter paludicola TaxID=2918171 RepID=A0ABM7XG00_9BACT|nr:hypothetical protein [Anaeromyxobacter paludicola]BDG10825.1 hypothetical protein AMPC_39380 [Anaeromyxobacter paludicola]
MPGRLSQHLHPAAALVRLAAPLALLAAGCHLSRDEREAATIAERNAAARGGLAAWRKVRALSISGRLEAGRPRDPARLARSYLPSQARLEPGARRALARRGDPERQVQLPFAMELKRPRMSRVEVKFQGQTAVQVFDGTRGFKLRPFLGRREVEPFTAEELRVASQQSELEGPLLDYEAQGSRVRLVGTEPVDGRDAYKLAVTSRDGEVRHVWVDAKSYLDVKVEGSRRIDGKVRPVFTYLRDYRAVDGLLFPMALETTVEGAPGSEKLTVERVAVNPELDDARFAKAD